MDAFAKLVKGDISEYEYKELKALETFAIGTRVKCIVHQPEGNDDLHKGMTGEVVNHVPYTPQIGVKWDVSVGGHDCSGHCAHGYGYYVGASHIEVIDNE